MNRGTNPLYPTSDDKGIKGAYETTVLMDDSDKTFSKTKSKQVNAQPELKFTSNTNSPYRKFSRKHREIMQNYKQELKKLKQQKKTGEISKNQFRQLKRTLAKETGSKNRAGFKEFLLRK